MPASLPFLAFEGATKKNKPLLKVNIFYLYRNSYVCYFIFVKCIYIWNMANVNWNHNQSIELKKNPFSSWKLPMQRNATNQCLPNYLLYMYEPLLLTFLEMNYTKIDFEGLTKLILVEHTQGWRNQKKLWGQAFLQINDMVARRSFLHFCCLSAKWVFHFAFV